VCTGSEHWNACPDFIQTKVECDDKGKTKKSGDMFVIACKKSPLYNALVLNFFFIIINSVQIDFHHWIIKILIKSIFNNQYIFTHENKDLVIRVC
jgi:hypothetical protein